MDEKEPSEIGHISVVLFESGDIGYEFTGALSPAHILMAAQVIRLEGEAMYMQAKFAAAQAAQKSDLAVARVMPQDHLPKKGH